MLFYMTLFIVYNHYVLKLLNAPNKYCARNKYFCTTDLIKRKFLFQITIYSACRPRLSLFVAASDI